MRKGRCPAPDPQWPRDLLLTGATGFLGAHLLAGLLAATAARRPHLSGGIPVHYVSSTAVLAGLGAAGWAH